jgi:hypothetical protein
VSISPVKIGDSGVDVSVQALMNTDCRCSTGFHRNLASLILELPRIKFKAILEYPFFDYSIDECHFFGQLS